MKITEKTILAFYDAIPKGLKIVYEDDSWIIGQPTTYDCINKFNFPITVWTIHFIPSRTDENDMYIQLEKTTGEIFCVNLNDGDIINSDNAKINPKKFITKSPQLQKFYESIILKNDGLLYNPKNWGFIDEKYITEQMQLLMVEQNGNDICWIFNAGITPSEAVQLAAVAEDTYSFNYIPNPCQSVIKLYEELCTNH